jgi:methionyl-tRNA formyltransferase
MRAVFLGTPFFAVPTLETMVDAGHEILGVFTQPDRPSGRGRALTAPPVKEAALRLGLAVHQPERIRRPEAVALLGALAPEVMVVVGYGQIIPQSIIDIPPCTPRSCPGTAARRPSSGPSPAARRSPA